MADRMIRLSKPQADDISFICSFGVGLLSEVAAAIEALPPTMKKGKVQEAISAVAGGDKAERIRRIIFSLATVHRRNFDDASSLLDSVSVPPEWGEQQRQKWRECKPSFARLLSAKSIVLAAKATDLSFDVERFCVGARIITDIRPVFDEQRSSIVGSTIRQTLRLEYMSIDGTVTSVSIGLDANDISRIRRACEEAMRKVSVVTETLQRAGITELLIPGKGDDE
jgi:hypothetical protein